MRNCLLIKKIVQVNYNDVYGNDSSSFQECPCAYILSLVLVTVWDKLVDKPVGEVDDCRFTNPHYVAFVL